ncbi:MAG: hypothetical protein ACRYG7_49785 [Janthinobacterium lividum]
MNSPAVSSATQRIRAKLDLLLAGQPVGYADFVREAEFGTVAAALSRLSKRGELKCLAKGLHYWSVPGRFGPAPTCAGNGCDSRGSFLQPAIPLPYRPSRL